MEHGAILVAALDWASDGVPVFPCGENKKPLTKNGHKDASLDRDTVSRMFMEAGNSAVYIGAAMGPVSGLFAIDLDLYKGEAPNEFKRQLDTAGLLPATRVHATKSGGLHYIYHSDNEWPNCKPCSGVEVKGDGGYIIVPPSDGYTVRSTGVADAPKELLSVLLAARAAKSAGTDAEIEAHILSGNDFHDSIAQLTARLAKRGLTQAKVLSHITSLMKASVAADPNHPRHARWASIMYGKDGELLRTVTSANAKYNPMAPSDRARTMRNMDRGLQIAAAMFASPPTAGEKEPAYATASEHDPDEFPYGPDDGNFASGEFNFDGSLPIIKDLFYEGETVIVSADPKVGKSTFAVDCALSISCGVDLAGELPVQTAGPCLYFALEGRTAIRKRIAAWKAGHRASGDKIPDDIAMFTVERTANFFDKSRRDKEIRNIIQANAYWIKQGKGPCRAIFVDTLTKAMIGGNQNDADDTAQLFEFISILRDYGVEACVVLIHHKKKAQKGDEGAGPRGSSNILAECDVSLQVDKVNDKTIAIKVADARSMESGAVYHREMVSVDLGKDKYGNEIASVYLKPVPVSNQVVAGVSERMVSSNLEHTRLTFVTTAFGAGKHDASAVVLAMKKASLTPHPKENIQWKTLPERVPMKAKYVQDFLRATFTERGTTFGDFVIYGRVFNGIVDMIEVRPLA